MGQPPADPMPACARRHFARGPCRAASGDGDIAGSLRSSPARSALSAFAVQLRPRFADFPASGIFHHCPIHPARDTQRYVRRPGGGPAVMLTARGAFAAFGIVLVCASYTIAKLRQPLTRYAKFHNFGIFFSDAHFCFSQCFISRTPGGAGGTRRRRAGPRRREYNS